MLPNSSLLVRLLRVIDRVPMPEAPPRRGRPATYSDRLMLKALAVMIIRRLYSPHALLSFLEQDDCVAARVGELLAEDGQRPSRRTLERRLEALSDRLPHIIGLLGRCLVEAAVPDWERCPVAAVDSTALKTCGGVWHRKDREAGVVPHTSIDREAGWSKSGWHGWWYGWKLHLAVTAGTLRVPMAAELTRANVSDNRVAPELVEQLPEGLILLLGDSQYRDPELDAQAARTGIRSRKPQTGRYLRSFFDRRIDELRKRLRHRSVAALALHHSDGASLSLRFHGRQPVICYRRRFVRCRGHLLSHGVFHAVLMNSVGPCVVAGFGGVNLPLASFGMRLCLISRRGASAAASSSSFHHQPAHGHVRRP